MNKAKLNPDDMSFLDHLEDLRWHVLRSFIAIFIVGIGAFIFKDFIFDNIICPIIEIEVVVNLEIVSVKTTY